MKEKIKVTLCVGTSCHLMGNYEIRKALSELPEGIKQQLEIVYVSCFGNCEKGPNVKVGDVHLEQTTSKQVLDIIKEQLGL